MLPCKQSLKRSVKKNEGNSSSVLSVVFSPDDKRVNSGSSMIEKSSWTKGAQDKTHFINLKLKKGSEQAKSNEHLQKVITSRCLPKKFGDLDKEKEKVVKNELPRPEFLGRPK